VQGEYKIDSMVWTYVPPHVGRPAQVLQRFYVGSSNCSGVAPSRLRGFPMDQCIKGDTGDWLKLTVQA
jgi:hypothetical protein